MNADFEQVYTMVDWYDGPRKGIADFRGSPHFYEWECDDKEDVYPCTFLLTPVSSELLSIALEDWAIWERWERAFDEGRTGIETHPALPEERARHDELAAILAQHLVTDRAHEVRARGEFRGRARLGLDLTVRWQEC